MFRSLFQSNDLPPDESQEDADRAAGNGQLAEVQRLADSGVLCSEEGVERAARGGHLAVVRYLIEHCELTFTWDAVPQAALFGHFDVVRYLAVNNAMENSDALCLALRAGHWHIAEFLISERNAHPTKDDLCYVVRKGKIDLAKLIAPRLDAEACYEAVEFAKEYGTPELIDAMIACAEKPRPVLYSGKN